MDVSVSSVDDNHMSEADPLANEAEKPSAASSREDVDTSTSASELRRLRDKRQYEAEPLSPTKDEEILPARKPDDPHTASWLDRGVLDKTNNPPPKPPSEQLKSDPRKISFICKFDEGTGIDPPKS